MEEIPAVIRAMDAIVLPIPDVVEHQQRVPAIIVAIVSKPTARSMNAEAYVVVVVAMKQVVHA
jgi:hypothetical protein